MNDLRAVEINITGVVQGVGFRPFVYNLANRHGLLGWVRNTSAGVEIKLEGPEPALRKFLSEIKSETPPLARIDSLNFKYSKPEKFSKFEILHSKSMIDAFQPISPDVCICEDCLRELFDKNDRRYLYPFINCTNCGPRFTIITDIPYDRPNTTMAGFPMCPQCAAEYNDPLNRRFHAQPVACPVCGPQVWVEIPGENGSSPAISRLEAIRKTRELLAQGKIIAIKGLGGFHLACDATNRSAVSELRKRKLRVDKPYALMMKDINSVSEHCYLDNDEIRLLESRERPIVLLQKNSISSIVPEIAPNQNTLGVMLPYTPLHYLLFSTEVDGKLISFPPALVMTSGNLSEEPIATDNQEAIAKLSPLADAFLMHDRPIRTRCDDSVIRVFSLINPFSGKSKKAPKGNQNSKDPASYLIRRSRGYAPFPIDLHWDSIPLLATGAELKNTFCLARNRYAFISHHIGDMENYETLMSFEDGIRQYEKMFHLSPEAVAYDLHPNYLSTRYGLQRAELENLPAFGIQHHHAHIASCMVEHNLIGDEPVIGVAFDGTGYGEDEAIWGGEFLITTYNSYERIAHLGYMPLPGGDAAIHKPARIALAYLWQAGLDWETNLPSVQALCVEEKNILRSQLAANINTPVTSSMGRLFDAIAALAGVCQKINYEAQAAIELEALVDVKEIDRYEFLIEESSDGSLKINPSLVIEQVLKDLHDNRPAYRIASRFHNGAAFMVSETCKQIRSKTGIARVVLSGGVWQNTTLLKKTLSYLEENGFTVYIHRKVPANDGGISLGQAAIAHHRLISN